MVETIDFLTIARFAVPRLAIPARIVSVEWVTLGAMCSCAVGVGGRIMVNATPCIFGVRNRFQMGRIYASAIAAQVVKFFTFRNRANEMFIRNLMSGSIRAAVFTWFAVCIRHRETTPATIFERGPVPALCRISVIDLGEKARQIALSHMAILPQNTEVFA